ncbi:MAG: 3-dehydroquinate synthase [Verrucomicrobia bacterium]|nr:3-dehydroquinate synthase [Verrucomicrobiota bacterium]MBU1908642.1 3-dehydroquinate synthase [Verrucomicrobiota bacterium]
MKAGRYKDRVLRQAFSVPVEFPVVFTRNLFHPGNESLLKAITRKRERRVHRVAVFVDAGVARAHPGLLKRIRACFSAHAAVLELVAPPLIVPGGERAKRNGALVGRLIARFRAWRLCRHSCIVAVGGGAVLDAVGLAAALFHRGLRLIRVPTTVLAQNDVGVGVKNAVNWQGVKNLVGTFSPPFAVLNDSDFLRTLPDRDWIGGIAEAFKVAIIRDARFFRWLVARSARLRARDPRAMDELIRRCAKLHLDHIQKGRDPFEAGRARPLDFGHWVAHKLEALTHFRIGHGQAVAIGLALDSCYAQRKGWLKPGELQAIRRGLLRSGFILWHPRLASRNARGELELWRGLEEFREHLGGELWVTYPRGIGRRHETGSVDAGLVEECVQILARWRRAPAAR